ncbi:hypothetical protein ABIB62_002733 [Mucilaginibacter sp. UYP25]|uniref:hypothetical protein n=1 Tax=unclassified Mucilaginibacter TaxID=2617802 RepID=UPI00339163A0
MNNRRRVVGEKNKTKENKAVATIAKNALVSILFMFCLIILCKVLYFLNFVQIIALNFTYARKNCYNLPVATKHYNQEMLI